MNSIEAPLVNVPVSPSVPAIAMPQQRDSGPFGEDQAPDGAALEMLRAMLGDALPAAPLMAQVNSEAVHSESVSQLLSKAINDGSLPPELLPLAREIQSRLQPDALQSSMDANTAVLVRFLLEELKQESPSKPNLPTPNPSGVASVGEVAVDADASGSVGAVLPTNGQSEETSQFSTGVLAGQSLPASEVVSMADPIGSMSAVSIPVTSEQEQSGAAAPLTTGGAVLSGGLPIEIAQDSARHDVLIAALAALLGDKESAAPAIPMTVPQATPADDPVTEPAALGNAILQSLNQQSSQGTTAQAAVGTASPVIADRIEQVSTLMTQMADRVLVTDPLHGQTPEVRIKVADHLMPGTEVRVWREMDGQLRVEFETLSAFWARALNEASPMLVQRLNERFANAEAAQVTVQHHGDQPEDGRSRNRQSPWELAQNPDEA